MLKFSGTSLKMTILRNFLIFHFFGKILTHASMGDCFFLYATPLPPKNQNVTWQEGKLYLYATYVWVGLWFGGGGAKQPFLH